MCRSIEPAAASNVFPKKTLVTMQEKSLVFIDLTYLIFPVSWSRHWDPPYSSVITSVPLVALFIFQIETPNGSEILHREWVVPLLLLLVSLIEWYIAQSNLRGDISASRVMGVQFHKLAEKWRLLWIYQDRENIEQWIDNREDLTNHMAVEHLIAFDENLRDKCQEEANSEFERQFGQ